ncbi:MAG TPA: hypothetical protein VHD56_19910 [Tepidisphaeraceae bacterium]|nr:hypothetical protein [Tepidisphaeraceae bacterium]
MESASQSVEVPLESRGRANNRWARTVIVVILIGIAITLTKIGLDYRRSEFDRTMAIRYDGDVTHGLRWGQVANKAHLFLVYDAYLAGKVIFVPNELDYTPLRITIMSCWARWVENHYPDNQNWQNNYDFMWPVIGLNTLAEWLSSILVFLLIRMWVIRSDDANRSPLKEPWPFRGVFRGMIGASFLWFNPCVIWDGTCFPQWDIWLAPFFLGALLLSCIEWWFAAGVCIATGAFLKGQILLVAPIFLVWPIVQLRWQPLVKFVAGFAFAAAGIALPWMRPDGVMMLWLILFITAIGITTPLALRWKLNRFWMIALLLASAGLSWPWHAMWSRWTLLPLMMIGVLGASRFAPPRIVPHLYALAIAVAIFLFIPLYGASTAWFEIGFEFGTHKFMNMATRDTYSLPWALETYFRWPDDPNQLVQIPLWGAMEFRGLMFLMYGLCLLLCGIGAAIHQRRGNPRFLIAFIAPWICWFVLLTQLNNRYMVWAAAFSALLPAVSWGMTALGAIVSYIGWMGIAVILCWDGGDMALARRVRPLTPHMIWPLLLAAGIYLWMVIAPRRRQQRLSKSDSTPEDTATCCQSCS